MKKIVLTGSLFVFMLSGLFAQDAKKLKDYLDKKQYDKAKAEVDAAITKTPNDLLALYYKGKVYAALAADPQFKTSVPDAREQAFEALKKAMDNDKDNRVMLFAVQDQHRSLIDLYGGYYQDAVQTFNAANGNKATYEQAMNLFMKSNEVGKYISQKKFANIPVIDTAVVMLIGQSAQMANKQDVALKNFKLLADSNIRGTAQESGLDYSLPYRWLSYYYKEAKDDANFFKYSSQGKKLFPKDDYYDAVMLDYYRDKKDYDALFKKYDEIVTAFPDSTKYHYNYGYDAFMYVYNSDEGTKVNNREALLKKMGVELEKALAGQPKDINTKLLLGQYYYNSGIELKDKANAIKGTKPEDVKKKADLQAQAKDVIAKAIPFGETSLSELEANGYRKSDKSKYKSISDLMQRIYSSLNQQDKVKIYQGKYDSADAKFVN